MIPTRPIPSPFRILRPLWAATVLLALALPVRAGVGVWTPLGPPGGSVTALAPSAGSPPVVFAGTRTGGVFKSTDGGITWSSASLGLVSAETFPPIESLELDPRRSAVLYAGTSGFGAYRSADAGGTWSRCGGLPTVGLAARIYALQVDPFASDVVLAATPQGVARSRDACRTWSPRRTGLPALPVVALGFDPTGRTLYAGLQGGGAYRSTDQGGSWEKANAGLQPQVRSLGFDPRSPSVVFAGTAGGLYRSVDRGRRWSQVGAESIAGAVLGIGFQRSTGAFYAATRGGVFVSSDRGARWRPVSGALPVPELISFAAGPEALFAGSNEDRRGGGVAVSEDGGLWRAFNLGLSNLRPTALAFHPTDPVNLYAGTGPVGVFATTHRNRIWSHLPLAPSNPLIPIDALVMHPGLPSVLFAGSGSPGLLLRSDGADGSWRSANPPSTSTLYVLEADPRSPGALWAGGSGSTYHTPDGGETWQRVTLAPGVIPDIHDIEVDPSDPLTVTYAGARGEGAGHPPLYFPLLYRTTDGGTTWSSIPTEGLSGTPVHFTADRDEPTVYYVATSGALFRTDDQGATWKLLFNFRVRQGDILATPGAIYASRGPSVLRSTDRGETWTAIRNGLGARPVERLWLDPHDPRHLFAGTFNAGLWEYTLPPAP